MLCLSASLSHRIIGSPPLSRRKFLFLTASSLPPTVALDFGHDFVSLSVDLRHFGLLFSRPTFGRVCDQEHVQQSIYHGIVLGIFDRSATCWTGVSDCVRGSVGVGGLAMLMGKPFFQARAAEGVQTVEQGQRLVEDLGTDETDQLFF